MATVIWETIKTMDCDRIGKRVSLLEERVYPADIMPDIGGTIFHARSRMCSCGEECNLKGCACKWSGLNPNYDPFAS